MVCILFGFIVTFFMFSDTFCYYNDSFVQDMFQTNSSLVAAMITDYKFKPCVEETCINLYFLQAKSEFSQ